MNIVDSVKTCLFSKYFNYHDRASRSEYWWFFLLNVIVQGLISFILTVDMLKLGHLTWLDLLYIVVALWLLGALLAVGIRRMHDINSSRALSIVGLIGVIASFWAGHVCTIFNFIFLFFDSSILITLIFLAISFIFICYSFIFIFIAARPSLVFANQYGQPPNDLNLSATYFTTEQVVDNQAPIGPNQPPTMPWPNHTQAPQAPLNSQTMVQEANNLQHIPPQNGQQNGHEHTPLFDPNAPARSDINQPLQSQSYTSPDLESSKAIYEVNLTSEQLKKLGYEEINPISSTLKNKK